MIAFNLMGKTANMKAFVRLISCLTILVLLAQPGAGQNWVKLTPASTGAPDPRKNSAAIYDASTHRMIVFGGSTATENTNDVWVFDFATHMWFDMTTSQDVVPAPRQTPKGVYEPAGHLMVIWSGQGASLYNDVWSFNLTTRDWIELQPPDPKPSIRYGAASIFDPEAKELVTFGGFTSSGRFNDTWRFNVDNVTWSDVSPAMNAPGNRCLHSASYDGMNHRMIIYGGQSSGALADIWAFDLNENKWTDLTPQDGPAGRWFVTNIYDSQNDQVVIFGGNLGSGKTNETWTFDLANNSWQQINDLGISPSERDGAAGIYVPSEGRMVIFGGDGGGLLNDLWSLDLTQTVDVTMPSEVPHNFKLLGNYPNPFNPITVVVFEISKQSYISLNVFNTRGQQVKSLVSGVLYPGLHRIGWDGTNESGLTVDSGVYFYELRSPQFRETANRVLLR